MRHPTLIALFAATVFVGLVPAKDAAGPESSLGLYLSTEDMRPAEIKIEIRTSGVGAKVVKQINDAPIGPGGIGLSDVPDGNYFVYFSVPGYASQWQTLKVAQGRGNPAEMNVKIYRKRYVVLHYVFNLAGQRDLAGDGLEEGRMAVSHWSGLPHFWGDWQVWQKSSDAGLFGDTPYLEFHRFSQQFGFAKAPAGVAFADLKEAPPNDAYQCVDTKAAKGLTLFCRVHGNQKEDVGYGKLTVEDVTDTPPAGVKVVDGR